MLTFTGTLASIKLPAHAGCTAAPSFLRMVTAFAFLGYQWPVVGRFEAPGNVRPWRATGQVDRRALLRDPTPTAAIMRRIPEGPMEDQLFG